MKKKSLARTPETSAAVAAKSRKRKRGRPQSVHGKVGREAIVVAARQLIEKMRPHQVTIALIAREAGVDPALVRYYFTNRELLLLAVVENILADWAAPSIGGRDPGCTALVRTLRTCCGFPALCAPCSD